MINKQGYTLAEVLVTIGVIGVIAAFTIPSLVQNTGNRTLGSSLARGFELVQQGFENIKIEAEKNANEADTFDNLAGIRREDLGLSGTAYITDDNTFYNETKAFLGTTDSDYAIADIKDYNGNNPGNNFTTGYTAYQLNKTKIVVMFQNAVIGDITNADSDDIISKVLIDANGNDKPNRLGRDVFLFGLTNSGTLIPAGTQQYHDFDNTVTVGGCNGDDAGNGTACAARVMADKWEIKYY